MAGSNNKRLHNSRIQFRQKNTQFIHPWLCWGDASWQFYILNKKKKTNVLKHQL
jgi:hypothetical protein